MNCKFLLYLLLSSCIIFSGCSKKAPQQVDRQRQHGRTKHRGTQRPYVIDHRTYYPIPTATGYHERGIASWYGKKFHGRKTANGETYDMYGHTAAHKTLPMGTMLLVKNIDNGKSTVVRINDRGPFVRHRIIDLTYTAAREIDMIKTGTANIDIIALGEKKSSSGNKSVKVKPAKTSPTSKTQLVHQDFDKGIFYIQVGAFEHKNNARKLAEKFAAKGRNVIIQQYPAAGISLYRVMVYSGTSLKTAKQHEIYLEQHGYPDALVLSRAN